MDINANPVVIRELAGEIINMYIAIYEATNTLDCELTKFGTTLDDDAYNKISSKVKQLIGNIENSKDAACAIANKLVDYADIIDDAERAGVGAFG